MNLMLWKKATWSVIVVISPRGSTAQLQNALTLEKNSIFSGNWIMNLHNYLYKYIHTKKLKIILFFLCPFKMKKKTCQKRTCWSTISVKSLNECTIFPFLVHLVNITRKSASLKAAKSSWWWLWIEDLSCRNVFWALTTVTQANHLLVLLVVHMFSKWEKNRD